MKILHGHTKWVNDVRYNEKGNRIISCSHDITIKIWDANTGAMLHNYDDGCLIEMHSNWITSVCYSRDGKMIVSGSYDKTIKSWDAETF